MERRNPPVAWGINYRAGMMSAPVGADLLDAASLGLAEMQDMRHWCNRADRADWTLTP
jgi:hypothetical protein